MKGKDLFKKLRTNIEGIDYLIPSRPFDHWKIDDNGDLISEPYSVNYDDLKKLIKRCDEVGVEFFITGNSQHYPGKTLKIHFYQKVATKEET